MSGKTTNSLRIKYVKGYSVRTNNSVSESFIIDINNTHLLYNCGNGILDSLLWESEINNIDLQNIKLIYISDIQDTSIGSVKSFIKHQYQTYGIEMKVYCEYNISEFLSTYLEDISYVIVDNEVHKEIMWKLYPLNKNKLYQNLFGDNMLIIDNGGIGHSLAIRHNKQWLLISGITNHIPHIEKFIRANRWEKVVLFHNNNSSLLCKTDKSYSCYFYNKVYSYGINDEVFDWKQVNRMKQYKYTEISDDRSF